MVWKLFSEMRKEFKKLYLVYKFLGVSWIIKEFRILMGSWFLIVSWLLIQSWLLIGSRFLLESWALIGSFVLTVLGPHRVLVGFWALSGYWILLFWYAILMSFYYLYHHLFFLLGASLSIWRISTASYFQEKVPL